MSDISTSKMIESLSKTAHAEENKGHFDEAGTLYKAIVTLEEMANFPEVQIKQAKKEAADCEIKAEAKTFSQELKEAMKEPSVHLQPPSLRPHDIYNSLRPKDSNDNGIFRQQRPSDSNDTRIHGRPHWQLPALDMSDSIPSQKLESANEHVNIIEPDTGSTRLIDTETEWLQKTNKQLPLSTDSDGLYPSKGCP